MRNKVFLFCLLGSLSAVAQTEEAKWNLGVHGGFTQYTGDLGQGWYRTDQAAYSFAGVSVSRYLNRYFDLTFMGTQGEAGYVGPRDYAAAADVMNSFRVSLSTLNLFFKYNFVGRESFVSPYALVGAGLLRQRGMGGHHPNRSTGWELPVPSAGLGINFRFGPVVSLQFQETFMYNTTDNIDYISEGVNDMYLMHTFGLTFNLLKRDRGGEVRKSGDIAKCPRIKTGPQRKDGEGKARLDKEKKRKWFGKKSR